MIESIKNPNTHLVGLVRKHGSYRVLSNLLFVAGDKHH